MKTDVITLTDTLTGMDLAIEAEEKFAAYYGITGRNALHLRLLTEEAISMVHGIFDDFSGAFWLESEKTKNGLLCRVCLSAEKQANREQESHMLSVASSGKNESARGVMGKIRELFRRSLQPASEEDETYLRNMTDAWMSNGTGSSGFAAPGAAFWSLQTYRKNVTSRKDTDEEAWDELEKSIIAKIADEVKVWLEADTTRVVIEKLITD
ncbi:MAG: hypothetical protein IKS42_05570 [Oscillospiraceae bacterium]|nr:hypothetical protein [Oscillospiraceae bacterium]